MYLYDFNKSSNIFIVCPLFMIDFQISRFITKFCQFMKYVTYCINEIITFVAKSLTMI